MRLGLKMLNSSSQLNFLQYLNQAQVNPGDTATILFQLVDLDLAGQRYIPTVGSTMSANLVSIDKAKNITKIPIIPFPDDRSIWSFNLSAFETLYAAGVNMFVKLTQGTDVKSIAADSVIIFGSPSKFSC